jgi:hypothetical protein
VFACPDCVPGAVADRYRAQLIEEADAREADRSDRIQREMETLIRAKMAGDAEA